MNIWCALILLCNHIIVISYSQDIDPDTFDFDNFDVYMTTEKFEYSTLDPLSFFPSVEPKTELPVEVETEIPSESSDSEINSNVKTAGEKEVTTEHPTESASTDLPKVDISDSQVNPDTTLETNRGKQVIVTTEASIVRESTTASLLVTTPKNAEDLLLTTTIETVDGASSTEVQRNTEKEVKVTTEANNVRETTKSSLLKTPPEGPKAVLPTNTVKTVDRLSSTEPLATTEPSSTTETIRMSTKGSESSVTSTEFPTTTININKVEKSSPSIENTLSIFDSTTQSSTSQMEIETTTLHNMVSTTVSIPQSTSGPLSSSIQTTSPKLDSSTQNSTPQMEIETTTLQNMASTTAPTPQSTSGPINSAIDRGISTIVSSSNDGISSPVPHTSTDNPTTAINSIEDLAALNGRETTTQYYEATTAYPGQVTDVASTEATTAKLDSKTIKDIIIESAGTMTSTEPLQVSTVPIESTTGPSTTTLSSISEISQVNSSTIQSPATKYIESAPELTSTTTESTTSLPVTSSTTLALTISSIKIEPTTTTLKTPINIESFTTPSNNYDGSTVTPSTTSLDGKEFPTLDPRLKIPIEDIPEPIEITTPRLDANNKPRTSEGADLAEASTMPVIEESVTEAPVSTTSKAIMATTYPETNAQLPDVTTSTPSEKITTTKPDESSLTSKKFPSTHLLTTTPTPEEDELPILEPRYKVPIDVIPEPFELTTPRTTPKELDEPVVTSAQPPSYNSDSNVKPIHPESTVQRVEDTNGWTDFDQEPYPTFDPNYIIPIEESEETVEPTTNKIDYSVKSYPRFHPVFKTTLTDPLQPSVNANHTFEFKLYPFFQTHSHQPKEPVTQQTPVFRFDLKFKKPIEPSENPVFVPRYHIKVMDPKCGCMRRVISPTQEPPTFYNPVKEHKHYHTLNPTRIWEGNAKTSESVSRINPPADHIGRKISVEELPGLLNPISVPAEVLSALPNFKAQETFQPTKTQHIHKNYLLPNQAVGFHVIPQEEVRIVTPTVQSPVQVFYKYNLGSSPPTIIKQPEQERPMNFFYKYSPEEGKTKIITPNVDESPHYAQRTFAVTPSKPILNKEFKIETGPSFQLQSTMDGCYYKVEEGPLIMDGDSSFGRLLIAPNICKRCFYCCHGQRGYKQCSRSKLSECLKRQLLDLPGRPTTQPQTLQQKQTSNSPCKLTKTWPDGMEGLPKFKVICS